MKKIIKTLPYISILLLCIGIYYIIWFYQKQIRDWKETIDKKNEIIQEIKLEKEKAQKTKINLIENEIKFQRDMELLRKKYFEQEKKKWESTVWYIRCLEIEGELELKSKKHELECHPYVIDELLWEYNHNNYKNLQEFSKDNLENKRKELGL